MYTKTRYKCHFGGGQRDNVMVLGRRAAAAAAEVRMHNILSRVSYNMPRDTCACVSWYMPVAPYILIIPVVKFFNNVFLLLLVT